MKILLVTNMYPSQSRQNYGVFVKEQADAVARCYPDVDYDVYYIDNSEGNRAYLKSIFEINRKIKSGSYDLVHVHYGLSALFMLNPLWRKRVPVVITLHGGDIQPEQGKHIQVKLTRRALRKADMAISLNDRMTSLAARCCPAVKKIPCSVNTQIFFAPEGRPSTAPDSNRPLNIVFPSDRTRTVKNFPLFEATMTILHQRYGLNINTVELKNMTRQQIADTLREADLMLMTSISEGSPQVVKEAMACNLPVVSTRVGDVDMLLDGVESSGWVDEPTAEALAAKVLESLSGKIGGIPGREKIFMLGLDDDSVARRVYDVYCKLLKPKA